MEIPKIIEKEEKQYKLVKQYPNYFLYEESKTHLKECFKRDEIEERYKEMMSNKEINKKEGE